MVNQPVNPAATTEAATNPRMSNVTSNPSKGRDASCRAIRMTAVFRTRLTTVNAPNRIRTSRLFGITSWRGISTVATSNPERAPCNRGRSTGLPGCQKATHPATAPSEVEIASTRGIIRL